MKIVIGLSELGRDAIKAIGVLILAAILIGIVAIVDPRQSF